MFGTRVYLATAAECLLLVVLVGVHKELYDFQAVWLLWIASPGLAAAHWLVFREKRLVRSNRLKLLFLTGPCVILCLSLILSLNHQLKTIAILGGPPKEMSTAVVASACVQQWTADSVARMNSERGIYSLLLISICLLYESRYREGDPNDLIEVPKRVAAIAQQSGQAQPARGRSRRVK